MAACHLRSISLPSRSHPLTLSIEEQLYKLKASQSSSIGHKLSSLKKLLECVGDLLQLPHAQRTLSHEAKPVFKKYIERISKAVGSVRFHKRIFLTDERKCSQPMAKSKKSGWFAISKLVQPKRVSCEVEIEVNEAEKIDDELLSLKSSKDISLSQLQNLLKELEAFESSIKEAEEELECIYRRLVKTRVSLLNILNH